MRSLIAFAFTLLAVSWPLAGCSSSKNTTTNDSMTDTMSDSMTDTMGDSFSDVDPLTLTGNVANGQTVFASRCATCHGAAGVGGIANPGSSDGTIPSLNPIDPSLDSAAAIIAEVESGSTPDGPNPQTSMPSWAGVLTPQQIADVTAYILSLNVTD